MLDGARCTIMITFIVLLRTRIRHRDRPGKQQRALGSSIRKQTAKHCTALYTAVRDALIIYCHSLSGATGRWNKYHVAYRDAPTDNHQFAYNTFAKVARTFKPSPIAGRSIAMSVCVCLSDRISEKQHVQTSRNFCTCYLWPWLGLPLTTMQCFVLPVLWMTSCLPIMDYMARG